MDPAVGLVKAYLEFCGYFVLHELPVREEERHGYRDVTDLDVVAVRFPHRPRASGGRAVEVFMGTDPSLGTPEDALDVVIGEVKEGEAQLNPGLRRRETVAFALRRVGCCPEDAVEREAEAVARAGRREMVMAGGLRCVVRLVAFAGRGGTARGASMTVPLRICAEAVIRRLQESKDVLAGTRLRDPVLEVLALGQKLDLWTPRKLEVGT